MKAEQYTLTRDNSPVLITGTYNEVGKHLHDTQSSSVDWACKWEGYKITLLEEKAS